MIDKKIPYIYLFFKSLKFFKKYFLFNYFNLINLVLNNKNFDIKESHNPPIM